MERGKCYLKPQYQFHCTPDSPIGLHSTAYALSDQKENLLEKNDTIDDDMICQDCFNLMSTLDKVFKKEGNNFKKNVYDTIIHRCERNINYFGFERGWI